MRKIYLRFFAELNEYLPEDQRQIWFEFPLEPKMSIQQIFQHLGVPNTEVDLILINQKSKGLEYIPHDEDRISVYPVFELFDISEVSLVRRNPLRNTKFICDVHLGRLCKFLRMLGLDSLYSNEYTNDQIISISLNEKRIILSRNYKLIKHEKVTHSYWIRSSDPLEQINDLIHNLQLLDSINPLSRCLNCNHKIIPVEKQKILTRVQIKTAKYFDEFLLCSNCNKIYWKGSHYKNMLNYIDQNILGNK